MTLLLLPLASENPLLPAWIEVILAVVFVLLLTFVIARFVVPRFEATYAERTAAIQGGIEKAEHAQAEAQAALEQYNAQLAEARTEAARIREDAKTQGAQIIAEMREQAQTESRRIIAASHAQLDADRQRVLTEMRAEVGDLATTLAGLIVGETLDDDARQQRTVERFIADLETEAATDGAEPADRSQPAEASAQSSGATAGSSAGPGASGPSPDAAPSTPGGGAR